MRIRTILRVGAIVVTASVACENPIAPEPSLVVGRWASASSSIGGRATIRFFLTLNSDGTQAFESRIYGSYSLQPNELASYNRVEGTYAIRNDSLFFDSHRQIIWDRFYGDNPPVETHDISPCTDCGDRTGSRFEVTAHTLVLHYISYPADAPVATTASYERMP